MDTIAETRFANIYVHFPFCEAKCHYCDFFSLPERKVEAPARGRIYDSIIVELKHYEKFLEPELDTLYMGGGTPSLVPIDTLERLLSHFRFGRGSERTIEANPSSITATGAREWKRLGLNRVSIGVQALNDDRLKWLGRVHGKRDVFNALDTVFSAGFESVSIDYIVGVPGQDTSMIEPELGELLRAFPAIDHVSAYLLTLKQSNPRIGELPEEATQLEHLRTVSQFLRDQGFEHYEISNFSRPGHRAKHNEKYWLGGSYLGVGPSAHSYWTHANKPGRRSKNWGSLEKYADLVSRSQAPVEWAEDLTTEQLRLEYLMLRLRRSEGLDLKAYQERFGRDLAAEKGPWLERWQTQGLCNYGSVLQLTPEGFFLSDQIVSQLL